MDDSPVLQRLRRVLEDALDAAAPAPEADMIEAGLIDSLALVTLLFEIEREFAVSVPLESLEIEDLSTMHSLAALIARLQSNGERA